MKKIIQIDFHGQNPAPFDLYQAVEVLDGLPIPEYRCINLSTGEIYDIPFPYARIVMLISEDLTISPTGVDGCVAVTKEASICD